MALEFFFVRLGSAAETDTGDPRESHPQIFHTPIHFLFYNFFLPLKIRFPRNEGTKLARYFAKLGRVDFRG